MSFPDPYDRDDYKNADWADDLEDRVSDRIKLCECGCALPAPVPPKTNNRIGHTKGVALRFRPGHHMRVYDHPAHLTNKYEILPSGCWQWISTLRRGGYGVVIVNKRRVAAHRYVYESLVGKIPEGLVIDHLCRNTSCVNPDHLEPVTVAVNNARGYGQSALNAAKTHCVNGHSFDDANTRVVVPSGRRECRECARLRAIGYRENKR